MRFIGVTGSREWANKLTLFFELDKLLKKYGYITIISGEAIGADTLAKDYYLQNKKSGRINYIGYPAIWKPNGVYDPQAGFKRNQLIVDRCDELIAFLVKSLPCKGTRDTINRARIAQKYVRIVEDS